MDPKAFSAIVSAVKTEVKTLNAHLKGKSFIVGNQVTMADIACATLLTPAFQLVFDTGFRKGMADLAKWFESFTSLP